MADPDPTLQAHVLHVNKNNREMMLLKDVGSLEVEICPECHYIRAVCTHEKSTWKHLPDCTGESEFGKCLGCLLECDFCGIDGT